MQYIDLHCHSIFSDGTMTPTELVEMACQENLGGLALTDHDTVDGVPELLSAAQKVGLPALSGVELSANHGDIPIHILGYGFDPEDMSLRKSLEHLQQTRKKRNEKIIANLFDLGIDVTYSEMQSLAGDGVVGRPHFGQLLISLGKVKNMQSAFDKYLRKDRPAYAAREKLPVSDAITIIHRAGGLAILAHPGTIPLDKNMTIDLIREFVEMGLDGIEAYYPVHSPGLRKLLLSLCEKEKLVITGGSDYHGDIRPGTRLGTMQKKQRVPLDVLLQLQERIQMNIKH
ncbi:MAG: PHP domain-containing protein [Thermodesulfobacteriota bacterium]